MTARSGGGVEVGNTELEGSGGGDEDERRAGEFALQSKTLIRKPVREGRLPTEPHVP